MSFDALTRLAIQLPTDGEVKRLFEGRRRYEHDSAARQGLLGKKGGEETAASPRPKKEKDD